VKGRKQHTWISQQMFLLHEKLEAIIFYIQK
jgi:hypothetical protein